MKRNNLRKEDLKEAWAAGAFTDQSQFGTAISNAKAIGRCQELDDMINLSYADIEGLFDE